MRISDWSSDVCSSDLGHQIQAVEALGEGHVPVEPAFAGGVGAFVFGFDPSRFPLVDGDLFGDGGDGGSDLHGGGPGAYDGDLLAGEVVVVFPSGGVELHALEVLQAWPVGVAGHVQ